MIPSRVIVALVLVGCGPRAIGGDAGDGHGGGADAGETACDGTMPRTCVGDDVHDCTAGGDLGALVERCPAGTCLGGRCVPQGCAEEARFMYVVTDDDRLLRFEADGDAHTFSDVGVVGCPAGPPWPDRAADTAHPYSMSVDRQGRAWVLYTSGEIFRVSTTDASCAPTSWVPGAAGFELFGMGFVADAPGATTEHLFIAGGAAASPGGGRLGVIDPTTLGVDPRGQLVTREFAPELSGTGDAALYAYYPGRQHSAVTRLHHHTATVQQEWPLPALSGIPVGWAFAHWGGRFYVFVTEHDLTTITRNAKVYRLDPATGHVAPILENLPFKIVGAGVSTCAPIIVN